MSHYILLLVLLTISFDSIDTKASSKPLLIKCCSRKEFYRPWLDWCLDNDVLVPSLNPPWNNMTVNLKKKLRTCPLGHISKSSTQFKLHTNGTLQVNYSSSSELVFQPGDFCLNEILTLGGPLWTSRFCIPEERYCGPENNCIRKCCPVGMAFNEKGGFCQKFDLNKNFTDFLPETLELQAGLGPNCAVEQGIDILEENEFQILSNGTLNSTLIFSGDDERITKKFCFDHFLMPNKQTLVKAFKCLPQYPKTLDSEKINYDEKVTTIYSSFMLVSSGFVIITLIVYALLPELRDIHGASIMCYLVSLVTTFISLSSVMLAKTPRGGFCTSIAVFIHFGFLSSFTWLNVICFEIFVILKGFHKTARRTLSDSPRKDSRFIFYSLYGWGVPVAIVGIGQVMDNIKNLPPNFIKPHLGVWACWFYKSNQEGMWLYLYGPMTALIGINAVLFTLTIIHLCHESSTDTIFGYREHWTRFRIIASLFLLMGVSWISEIVTFAVQAPFEYTVVTDILNILTGLYVFIIFVCTPTVWNLLKKKFSTFQRVELFFIRGRKRLFGKKAIQPHQTSAISNSSKTSDSGVQSGSELSESTLQSSASGASIADTSNSPA